MVRLRADGTAAYVGTAHVAHLGSYHGVVPPAEFQRLAKLLRTRRFFSLSSHYRRPISDLSSILTTAVRSRARKTVEDYGQAGPSRLRNLEQQILATAAGIAWTADATATPAARDGEAPGKAAATAPSGIRGQARIGPVTPVQRPGEPATRPFPGAVLVARQLAGAAEVARVTADASGAFVLRLPPGTYLLEPLPPHPGAPYPHGKTQHVTVRAGCETAVIVEYDSGIR